MFLLLFVEAGYALDGHIIGLSSSRGEDNVFGVGANKVGDVLRKR